MTRHVVGYWSIFFQAEDGIRDLVRSRGLGDVYKRQRGARAVDHRRQLRDRRLRGDRRAVQRVLGGSSESCPLYTSDAADERSSVDLGGRRIIKKKTISDRVQISHMTHKTRPLRLAQTSRTS